MTTKDGYRGDRRPGLHLSPEVERYFQKAHPLLLGKLKGAAMGKSTPESRAFFKSCRELSAKLRPSSRNSDSKLAVPVSTGDRKSTRLNSSHLVISYAVFFLKKKKKHTIVVLHAD